jgi:methylated-DNA-[protein]-cysteine S-methyltransferase
MAHGGSALRAASATVASDWGPVLIVATSRGVIGAELRTSPRTLLQALATRLGAAIALHEMPQGGGGHPFLRSAVAAVAGAHDGDPAALGDVPLDWTGVAAWDRRVLEGARTVGPGEVTSYGRLARRIGAPGAARAVGAALGRNPFWLFVPCHRVVAGDGSLGGYGDEPDALDIKRDLLAREGIALPITRLVD